MKKAKVILSSLLAALFFAVSLPLSALPVMASGFAGGNGTADNPYLIRTPAQLQAMEGDLSAHYQLASNISLSQTTWRPIGDADHPFTGSLEGNGYSITGLNLSYSGTSAEPVRAGLFDLLQGSVKHLSLSGSITADLSGTAIQAGLLAAELQDAAVSDCTFAGEMILTTSGSESSVYAALLAGTMNNSTVSNCTTDGSLQVESTAAGRAAGITGSALGCTISSCTNQGDVSVLASGTTTSAQADAAGIVADLRGDTQVNDCHNYGSITSYGSAMANGGGIVGILGDSASDGSVTGCANAGAIDVYVGGQNYAAYGGGIAGQNRGDITDCHNTGSVHVSDWSRASLGGGVVGGNLESATISGCSNTGDVVVEGNLSDSSFSMDYAGTSYAGGLAGLHDGSSKIEGCWNSGSVHCYSNWSSSIAGGLCGSVSAIAAVENAFNTGSVSAYQEGDSSYSSSAGGIVGHNGGNDNPDLLHCYSIGRVYANGSWGTKIGSSYFSSNSDCYALGDGRLNVRDGGYIQSSNISYVSQTPEEMEQQSTYAAFDFDTVWQMGDGASYPYPTLRDNPYIAPQEDATRFAGGSGMPYDPYQISNAAQLNNMRQELGAYYTLTEDIAFSPSDFVSGGAYYHNGQGWTPIGADERYPFFGLLEGGGHTISGVTLTPSGSSPQYVGLFGGLGATIRDLNITDLTICASFHDANQEYNSFYVGGLAGRSYNSLLEHITVSGTISAQGEEDGLYLGGIFGSGGGSYHQQLIACTNHASLQGESQNRLQLGGIAGACSDSTLEDCANTGKIASLSGGDVGGLIGSSTDGTFTGGVNSGDVSVSSAQNSEIFMGGIVGVNSGTNILQCANTGNITGENIFDTTDEEASHSTFLYAGGIVGRSFESSPVSDSYNTGDICASSAFTTVHIGGITGICYYRDEISRCWNSGSLTGYAPLYSYAGGIVGYSGYVTNCYNTGDLSLSGSQRGTHLGGIAARTGNSVSNSYNTGSLSYENAANLYHGPIVGRQEDGTVTNCYYLDTSHESNGIGTPLTAQQLTQQQTFAGFDFDSTWTMAGNPDYPYPELDSTPMVLPKEIIGLVILSLPSQTTYQQGETLNLAGLTIAVQYSDGSRETVTDYTVSGYDPQQTGQQQITLSYGGQSASFTVTVQAQPEAILESLAFDSYPDKMEYTLGEPLDLTGLEVVGLYSDGSRRPITGYTVSGYDPNTSGSQRIVISYQGVSYHFWIEVRESSAQILTGDYNNDGSLSVTDVMTLAQYICGNTSAINQSADFNNDGKEDVLDVMYLAQHIVSGA